MSRVRIKPFDYNPETGPKGLFDDKPVFVISSRGAEYGDVDPDYPIPVDFQTPYLRHIFGFMGLKDVRFIAANGMDMGPASRAGGPVSPCRSLQLLRSTRP